jgi:hypothetical protein
MPETLIDELKAARLDHLASPAVLAELEPDELPEYFEYLHQVLARKVDYLPAEARIPFTVVA